MKHPVTVLVNNADIQGEVTITTAPELGSGFVLTNAAGQLVASCSSGRALSHYAFDNGAERVRHAYHLGLEPQL